MFSPSTAMRLALAALPLLQSAFTFPTEPETPTPDHGAPTPNGPHKSICILPLGDSITAGWLGTETINGYRLPLLNYLTGTEPIYETVQANATTAAYQQVTTVGFFQVGNFTQHFHEGWIGFRIGQIMDKFRHNAPSYRQAPDVVLLHAGSDDLIDEFEVKTAPERLSNFIDLIYHFFPQTTIAVAEVAPFANSTLEALRKPYTEAVMSMALARMSQGQKLFTVNMGSALTDADLFDGVHPNTSGYQKMGAVWADGIREAQTRGLLP